MCVYVCVPYIHVVYISIVIKLFLHAQGGKVIGRVVIVVVIVVVVVSRKSPYLEVKAPE